MCCIHILTNVSLSFLMSTGCNQMGVYVSKDRLLFLLAFILLHLLKRSRCHMDGCKCMDDCVECMDDCAYWMDDSEYHVLSPSPSFQLWSAFCRIVKLGWMNRSTFFPSFFLSLDECGLWMDASYSHGFLLFLPSSTLEQVKVAHGWM